MCGWGFPTYQPIKKKRKEKGRCCFPATQFTQHNTSHINTTNSHGTRTSAVPQKKKETRGRRKEDREEEEREKKEKRKKKKGLGLAKKEELNQHLDHTILVFSTKTIKWLTLFLNYTN